MYTMGDAGSDSYILAFDLCTTALKVGLVTMDGRIIHGEIEAQAVTLLPGGGAEPDPELWWAAIVRASAAPGATERRSAWSG